MKRGFLAIITVVFSLDNSVATVGDHKEKDVTSLKRNSKDRFYRVRKRYATKVEPPVPGDQKTYWDVPFYDYLQWDSDKVS